VNKWWNVLTPIVLVGLAALNVLWPILPAQAQDTDPVRLSTLEIALWPEFDEPEVLVIFQGRLVDDVPLPAQLTLTMPQEAGEPHAVAAVDEEGNRWTAEYDVQATDDEIEVTYTSLRYRAFQFEYYLDILQMDGERREFTFHYSLDVPVDDLALELQQPLGATNVVLTPSPAEAYAGFAGLTYHRLPFGAVSAGQAVTLQVAYDKTSSHLSAEALPTDSPEPVATASEPLSSGPAATAGIVFVVGVGLALVAGGFWIVGSRRRAGRRVPNSRSRGPKPPKQKGHRDKKGTGAPVRSKPTSVSSSPRVQTAQPVQLAKPTTVYPPGGFCHQCGTALKEDALFCHRCGTRRKEG
jgi:hypothetical protein